MLQIDIASAKPRLSELIDKAINGEEVAIAKDGQSLVKLVPLSPVNNSPAKAGSQSDTPEKRKPRTSLFGSAKGLIWIADRFDEPLEDFKDYM